MSWIQCPPDNQPGIFSDDYVWPDVNPLVSLMGMGWPGGGGGASGAWDFSDLPILVYPPCGTLTIPWQETVSVLLPLMGLPPPENDEAFEGEDSIIRLFTSHLRVSSWVTQIHHVPGLPPGGGGYVYNPSSPQISFAACVCSGVIRDGMNFVLDRYPANPYPGDDYSCGGVGFIKTEGSGVWIRRETYEAAHLNDDEYWQYCAKMSTSSLGVALFKFPFARIAPYGRAWIHSPRSLPVAGEPEGCIVGAIGGVLGIVQGEVGGRKRYE